MTRDALASAADRLEDPVGEASDETAERLETIADQLRSLAEADTDPDHGRLARIESKLHDVADEGGDDVASAVDAALEDIHEFRETLEGV
jgi:hypothetical protein